MKQQIKKGTKTIKRKKIGAPITFSKPGVDAQRITCPVVDVKPYINSKHGVFWSVYTVLSVSSSHLLSICIRR